jgi:hypothetical protein
VYAVAQRYPGTDGLYVARLDEETTRAYIRLAGENDLLVFLDLQIGRSDVEAEIRKVMPYLEEPHVHLALDPEFAMDQGEVPGRTIGSLDGSEINEAQSLLEELVQENALPDKILVVHQFMVSMVTRPELIDEYPHVKLVIDMDGFGSSGAKRSKFHAFAAPAEYSGIKLFFRYDTDLMSEEAVLKLNPDVIIYQ